LFESHAKAPALLGHLVHLIFQQLSFLGQQTKADSQAEIKSVVTTTVKNMDILQTIFPPPVVRESRPSSLHK
jgi:hypothetical protein